jgi:membrane-associated phospholipid phosphatase
LARNLKAPILGCLASAAGFVILAALAYGVGSAKHLDTALLARFAERGTRTDSVAAGVAHLADPVALLAMLAIACGIALARRQPRNAIAALFLVGGANLTAQLLKVLLAHPRFQPLFGPGQLAANSFPSGHATAAASIAIAYAFVVPRDLRPAVAVVGTCFVAAVGCSVMALSWHYPSDVLGGILVASGWGFAALAALRATQARPRWQLRQLGSRAAISVK